MFDEIKQSLHDFGVDFDVYFYENDAARVRRGREGRRRGCSESGPRLRADGAVWLRTTDFGDDKDRVLIKSDGEPDLLRRRPRLLPGQARRGASTCASTCSAPTTTATSAGSRPPRPRFGDDPDDRRGPDRPAGQPGQGRPAGPDEQAGRQRRHARRPGRRGRRRRRRATRWPARRSTRRSTSTSTCWSSAANDNPVFYVQYAHARTRNAAAQRRRARHRALGRASTPSCSTSEREAALLGALGEFPRVVATAAELRAPHRVARYLEELAGTYHRFYDACRVCRRATRPATEPTDARLWLGEATRIVLANGLGLLGVSAPERM